MKVGIYQATWGGIGGAELYAASVAEVLSRRGHSVEVVHHNPNGLPLSALQDILDVDLGGVGVRQVPRPSRWDGRGRNPFAKFAGERGWCGELSRPYDLFINSGLTVPFFCHAPRGALLTHFPMETADSFHGRTTDDWRGRSPLAKAASRVYQGFEFRRRMGSYRLHLANSEFTRRWLRAYWGVDAEVVYPPLRRPFGRAEKRNRLVSVGRFDPHIKNYELLVRSFLALCDGGLKGWEYVIVGGLNDRGQGEGFFRETLDHLKKLESIAAGYPVSFLTNLGGGGLRRVMESASVFWHAAGYGVDEARRPDRMEHFGIVTAEAMAAGCVPVVFGGGGQREIVRPGVDGYTWSDPSGLLAATRRLIHDPGRLRAMSENAVRRSERFARGAFEARLLEVIGPLLGGPRGSP